MRFLDALFAPQWRRYRRADHRSICAPINVIVEAQESVTATAWRTGSTVRVDQSFTAEFAADGIRDFTTARQMQWTKKRAPIWCCKRARKYSMAVWREHSGIGYSALPKRWRGTNLLALPFSQQCASDKQLIFAVHSQDIRCYSSYRCFAAQV